MEREAAERAADVLLAVAPHQLGDLRSEPRVDLGVALGVVGEEVDRRELDRLEERVGLRPSRGARSEGRGARRTKTGSIAAGFARPFGGPSRSLQLPAAGPNGSGSQTSSGSTFSRRASQPRKASRTDSGEQARRSSGIAWRL